MRTNCDESTLDPTPEQVEWALEAFQQGRPEEFDRLLGDTGGGGPGVCGLLAMCAGVIGEGPVSRPHRGGSKTLDSLLLTRQRHV